MIFSRHASATATAVAASSALFASTLLVVTAASTPATVVDAGILALSSSTPRHGIFGANRMLQGLCPEGFVECTGGYLADGTTPCSDGCYNDVSYLYDCCDGVDACTGFTGKVCKDGSCNGDSACDYASIPIVVGSCKGYQSCYSVGYVGNAPANKVGNFINSCIGSEACDKVAYDLGGGVGSLENMCTAERACKGLGDGVLVGPVTSNLKGCCTTFEACFQFSEQNIAAQCKVVSTPAPSPAPSSTKPSSTQPTSTKPSTTKPSSTQPPTTLSSSAKPSSTQPSTTKPSTTKPSSSQQPTTLSSSAKPSSTQPSTTKPSTTKPSSSQPSSTKLSSTKPSQAPSPIPSSKPSSSKQSQSPSSLRSLSPSPKPSQAPSGKRKNGTKTHKPTRAKSLKPSPAKTSKPARAKAVKTTTDSLFE